MNSLLKITNIKKNYVTDKEEIEAIKDISLDVYQGEILTLIGSSGCGKSSLLSILSGIDQASSGFYLFNKENPKIGYMLQNDALFPWLTIYQNALLGLKIQKNDTNENKEYVKKLFQKYKLEEFMDKYPHELSGGMRQRVVWMQYRHRQ